MAYCTLKSYKLRFSPFEIFEALKNEKNCFFLDSSLNPFIPNYSLGRYSFLGIDPFYILETKNRNPFKELKGLLSRYKIPSFKRGGPPFLGGAVGYLAYDLGFILEKKIKPGFKPALSVPDCVFGFYSAIIIIDHFKQLFYIFSAGFPEKTYHLEKLACKSNIKKIEKLLLRVNSYKRKKNTDKPAAGFSRNKSIELKSSFTKKDYILAVKKAKEYIKKGDIYQVNLSQAFQARTDLSGFEIYRRLRKISPAYFNGYLDCGSFQILSSSPEGFLRLRNSAVVTRPMKGTRPRSKDKAADARLKKELFRSVKDRAELMMIVDLERNDLGKVCDYNSIKVDALRELEEYNTVFQATATISGRLNRGKDRVDLLRACFPGGSITGCPKIRAMEIIEELEPSRRSVYTGALGYLSFSGDMDFNILIRTILKKADRLYFSSGGGIVADSHPEAEYQETLVKAEAMIKAINPYASFSW